MRGKITIHFQEPQRQGDADGAADRCAALAVAYLREQPDHGPLIGAEVQISAELTARYPLDLARPRAVELAALHVVGDPALSDELRRASSVSSSSLPAVNLGNQGPPSVPPSRASRPGSMPPGASGAASAAPVSTAPGAPGGAPRRRGTSQIRSIQSLLMPPGTSPAGMAQFVAPLVRDSAARVLIGFLRAHDLIAVRGVSIDENSAEMLANLVPVSDAPPGGYEASRAGEIARWQTTLGQGVMFALQRQVKVVSAYLAKDALARAEVMPTLADAVLEAVCAAAFPDEAGLLEEVARFPTAAATELIGALAADLTRVAGTEEEPASMAAALAPLLGMVQEDLNVTAGIIKQSSGG